MLTISVDLQLLVGLILYFVLSPITKIGLRNFATAMQIPPVRFFTRRTRHRHARRHRAGARRAREDSQIDRTGAQTRVSRWCSTASRSVIFIVLSRGRACRRAPAAAAVIEVVHARHHHA
jgi:hypothetical protein